MGNNNIESRFQWRSTMSYFLVTLGAIVGLGNVIQFPYLVTQYGGLFFITFLLFEIFLSVPLLFCELLIGRRGKQNPVGSISLLALEAGASRHWQKIGWLCFVICMLTLGYYTVQSAFPLNYMLGSVELIFNYGADEPVTLAAQGNFLNSFLGLETAFIVFLLGTMVVIIRGLNRGLETISLIFVPMYFIILLLLAIYTSFNSNFLATLKVLFTLNFSHSTLTVVFAALSYALFRLNTGMGIMIVYGSYLPYSTSFGKTTLWIIIFDVLTSILSFLVIYPLMLKTNLFMFDLNNLDIIKIFAGVPGGLIVSALFFFMAILTAWTCTIAMAETAVVTLAARMNISRIRSIFIVTAVAFLVGTFAVFTYSDWINQIFSDVPGVKSFLKNIIGNILIPLSALLVTIFVAWVVKPAVSRAELRFKPGFYPLWLFIVRYIGPLFIIIVWVGMTLVVFIPNLV